MRKFYLHYRGWLRVIFSPVLFVVIALGLSGCSEQKPVSYPHSFSPFLVYPTWSPDGSHLAFLLEQSGGNRLVVIPVHRGPNASESTAEIDNVSDIFPRWALPNGASFGCIIPDIDDLHLLTARGLSGQLVIFGPDMKRIRTYRYRGLCYGFALEPNGSRAALSILANEGGDYLEIHSPDGRLLPNEGTVRYSLPKNKVFGFMQWQPGGELVACFGRLDDGSLGLLGIDIRDGRKVVLVSGKGIPGKMRINAWSWSKDGKQLFFMMANGHYITDLYSKEVPGSRGAQLLWRILLPDGAKVRTPSWSSDHKQIIFAAIQKGGKGFGGQVCVGDLEHKQITPLPSTWLGQFPALSPNGQEVAFVSDRDKLMVGDIQTGQVRQVWPSQK